MTRPLLDVDLGELRSEPARLYELCDLACVACGGHAGDDASMAAAVAHVARAGARLAAHPSYPDREGFGRRTVTLPRAELAASLAAQVAALSRHAAAAGVAVTALKPHGALYHDADRDPALARLVVEAGDGVAIVGPPGGARAAAAREAGAPYLREGFADRGVGPDGKLLPRGTPGALVLEPAVAAARARALAASGEVEAICVHGDSPGAVAIAEAVRAALEGS